jgi:hypothetical protein
MTDDDLGEWGSPGWSSQSGSDETDETDSGCEGMPGLEPVDRQVQADVEIDDAELISWAHGSDDGSEHHEKEAHNQLIHEHIFVNGMQTEAVWDTGASESFITPEAAHQAKATLHRLAKPMTYRVAGSSAKTGERVREVARNNRRVCQSERHDCQIEL